MKSSIGYEYQVAEFFEKLGYTTEVTNASGDFGVDVFAQKEGEKIAVQAKNYGNSSRKVNRNMIMQLHGAKDLFKCTKAIIVTSGDLLDDARKVAKTLNIDIIRLEFKSELPIYKKDLIESAKESNVNLLSFQEVWNTYVLPLKGKSIVGETGLANKIIAVSNSNISRITKNGRANTIPIEPFRFAYQQIVEKGFVTRDEINQQFEGRISSGVVLVFSNIPIFEVSKNPLTVRFKK